MHPNEYPEIAEWIEDFGGNVDYLDFASMRLTLGDWISVSKLLNPTFVNVDGCYIWDRAYDARNFTSWKKTLNDATEIEKVLNQVKLSLYIDYPDDDVSANAALSFAYDIATCWRRSLLSQYPHAKFTVYVTNSEDGPIVNCTAIR